MAVYNPNEYKCRFCKARGLTGCGGCAVEENRRKIHRLVTIRALKRLPQNSTLPPETKRINGRRYRLLIRYQTRDAAADRAKALRRLNSNRIGYSIRVVSLPESQWGAKDWDIKPFALYVLYGRER